MSDNTLNNIQEQKVHIQIYNFYKLLIYNLQPFRLKKLSTIYNFFNLIIYNLHT